MSIGNWNEFNGEWKKKKTMSSLKALNNSNSHDIIIINVFSINALSSPLLLLLFFSLLIHSFRTNENSWKLKATTIEHGRFSSNTLDAYSSFSLCHKFKSRLYKLSWFLFFSCSCCFVRDLNFIQILTQILNLCGKKKEEEKRATHQRNVLDRMKWRKVSSSKRK